MNQHLLSPGQLLLEGPLAVYARLSSRSPRPGGAFSYSMVALVQNVVVNCGQIRNGLKKLEASGMLAEVPTLERSPPHRPHRTHRPRRTHRTTTLTPGVTMRRTTEPTEHTEPRHSRQVFRCSAIHAANPDVAEPVMAMIKEVSEDPRPSPPSSPPFTRTHRPPPPPLNPNPNPTTPTTIDPRPHSHSHRHRHR